MNAVKKILDKPITLGHVLGFSIGSIIAKIFL